MRLFRVFLWNWVNNGEAKHSLHKQKPPHHERFAKVWVQSSIHLEPSNTLSSLYAFFSASEGRCTLRMLSGLLEPSSFVVSVKPTVSTIMQLQRWDVLMPARFMCTLGLLDGDVSKTFMHPNCSRSSTTLSFRWHFTAYTAQVYIVHTTWLQEAVWTLLHVVSVLLPLHHLPLYCSWILLKK